MILGLFAAGKTPWDTVWGIIILLLGLSVVFTWSIDRMHQGIAELTPTQLVVQTRGGRDAYRWEHIADVRVVTIAESGPLEGFFARMSGVDPNRPVVLLRLRRSLRIGIWSRTGTDVVGPPSLVLKKARLFLDNPEGFVQEAQRYLTKSGDPS